MKKNWLLIVGIALLLGAALWMVTSANRKEPRIATRPATQATSEHDHSPNPAARVVPAFLPAAPAKSSLRPTVDPNAFTGITRDAYRAVREIPTTIAQLPCYCHCDQSFGHKSLYSCFEDDHASHCDICVREALLALRLERDQKMSPEQIRQTIIGQYSR